MMNGQQGNGGKPFDLNGLIKLLHARATHHAAPPPDPQELQHLRMLITQLSGANGGAGGASAGITPTMTSGTSGGPPGPPDVFEPTNRLNVADPLWQALLALNANPGGHPMQSANDLFDQYNVDFHNRRQLGILPWRHDHPDQSSNPSNAAIRAQMVASAQNPGMMSQQGPGMANAGFQPPGMVTRRKPYPDQRPFI